MKTNVNNVHLGHLRLCSFDDIMALGGGSWAPAKASEAMPSLGDILPPLRGPCDPGLGGRSSRSVDLKLSLRPSPPCNVFPTDVLDPTAREEKLKEAIGFLDMALWLCEVQEKLRAYYILEHPPGTLSWKRRNALPSAQVASGLSPRVLESFKSSMLRWPLSRA